MTKDQELVTLVHYRLLPVIEEAVMTREEFDSWNQQFQDRKQDPFEVYEDLSCQFVDWGFGQESYLVPKYKEADRYFFKAYKGDITSGTDDVLYMDQTTPWTEPLKHKSIPLNDKQVTYQL